MWARTCQKKAQKYILLFESLTSGNIAEIIFFPFLAHLDLHEVPPVHDEVRPGDKGALVGGEERDGPGHVLGLPAPAQGVHRAVLAADVV